MAKGGLFTGNMRGKLGETVFSRRNGNQVSRIYIDKIKNPKSDAQMEQRTKLANIISAYRSMRNVIQKGFENKSLGRTDYNEFVSANLNAVNVFLSKEMANAGANIVAPYQITRGTLPTVLLNKQSDALFVSNIAVEPGFTVTAETTIGELSTSVISSNSQWAEGDKMTLVFCIQLATSGGAPISETYVYALVLDSTSNVLINDIFDTSLLAIWNDKLSVSNTGAEGLAIVHSRLDENSKLKVSSQSIVMTSDNALYYSYNSEEASTRAKVSYRVQQGVVLNPNSGDIADSSIPVVPTQVVTAAFVTANGIETEVAPNPTGVVNIAPTGSGQYNLRWIGTNLDIANTLVVENKTGDPDQPDLEEYPMVELINILGWAPQYTQTTQVGYSLSQGIGINFYGLKDVTTGQFIYLVGLV